MDSANNNKQAVMSLFEELKRRNVIRVAIAYAVAAWLLIEITATTFPILKLPNWSVTLVTVLVLIGFPLALILAWAFELTPEGIKLEKEVVRSESITRITGRKLDFIIITVLVLALVYFTYDEFVIEPAQEETLATDSAQEIVATEVQQSIAVLPFVNMSPDPDQEYFSDGLSEEILNLLAKIPDLKVIARTSSFSFKGTNEDARSIGATLGVKTLLEGSVRKAGERVRITAQLIDVSDGSHIWSDTYDRTLTDIFAIQDDVAAAIIDALQIHVGANPTRGRPTENIEAYALFLKGREQFTLIETPKAREYLLQAVALDPGFAEAYELLAFVSVYVGDFIGHEEARKLSLDAATKALQIDPNMAFARFLWNDALDDTSWTQTLRSMELVARDNPGNQFILDHMIEYLGIVGYFREAHEMAEKFVYLNPLDPRAHGRLFLTLSSLGRREEAVEALGVAAELGGEIHEYWAATFQMSEQQNDTSILRYEAAISQMGIDASWVRDLFVNGADPSNGQAYLDRRIPEIVLAMPEDYTKFFNTTLTYWYLFFGFLDRYYELIFEAGIDGWTDGSLWIYMGTISRQTGFTAHPKYLEVAEKTAYVEAWDVRGPPDHCEKTESYWVCE